MKRCPECEFLYEDEQELCDMDGTALRFTSFLLPSAAPAPNASEDRKSVWAGVTIALLALVVIGSVLVTLYRATPKLSSSSGSPNQPAATNQDTKPPVSDSPQSVTTPAIREKATDPFASPAMRTQDPVTNSTKLVESASEKQLTIGPSARDPFSAHSVVVNAPKAAATQTSPAAPANPKATPHPNTTANHPEALPMRPVPQSQPQNQDKDSKVKSLFKKAGRVFKKPF